MDFLLQPVSFCRSLSGFRAKLSRLPTNYARRRPSDVTDTKTCVCAGGREHARTENGACGVLWAREREEIREISRRVTNRARTVNVIGHGYLPRNPSCRPCRGTRQLPCRSEEHTPELQSPCNLVC